MKESQAFVAILSAFTNILRKLDEAETRCKSIDEMVRQLKAAQAAKPPIVTCRGCGQVVHGAHMCSGPFSSNPPLSRELKKELADQLPPVGEL